ncbi:MAG TPA: tetratricopeptide repeat protein [Bacteroidales bacterium]|nr:tetratricopeptide repeat protein [Bacteroidales bacterium]HPS63196.1 tetratricopeptide repeat protein [Bacteroidales bacterium]
MGKEKRKNTRKGPVPKEAGNRLSCIGYAWLAGILALTLIVFVPTLKHSFVAFDDPQYVENNPFIRGFTDANLKEILTGDANNLGNYHPITLLSYSLNYAVSGTEPRSYHLFNILLHLANTLLVFFLSHRLFRHTGTGPGHLLPAAMALLFGIHPLHVESVAWISGRKDLLYTCFYLLSLMGYLRYLEKKLTSGYLLSILFFIFSLLSKGMAVTLPLVLMAVDYLSGRNPFGKRQLLEKVPFFLLSLVFGLVAIVVQHAQGATEIVRYGLPARFVIASYGFTQYLLKTLVPYSLCGYYPYPDLHKVTIPTAWFFSVLPFLLFLGALAWMLIRGKYRMVSAGFLFFLFNVMFVLQLFPVGSAVMADRYTYLSSFGLFLAGSAGLASIVQRYPKRKVLVIILLMAYAGVLAVVSAHRTAAWHDRFTFWGDVAEQYPRFYPALNNLGEFYENEGDKEKALHYFTESIAVTADNPNAWFHLGSMNGKAGKFDEAISGFTKAIACSPGFTQAYINRAIARAMKKDYPAAMADLDTVLSVGANESAYFNRAILRNEMKDYRGAISDFTAFLGLNPSSGQAYYNRGLAYLRAGVADSACPDLQKAVSMGVNGARAVADQYCSGTASAESHNKFINK